MAYSRITKIGDGASTQFTVNFSLGYLSQGNITARVGTEVDGSGQPAYRPITFLSEGLLQIGGPPAGIGVRVLFERTVQKDALLVNYSDGDVLDESNLDVAQKQAMMVVHEVLDGRFATLTQDLDHGGFRGINVGAPIAATDAATKQYVDASFLEITDAVPDIIAVANALDDIESLNAAVNGSLRFTPQNLTAPQKAQALTNQGVSAFVQTTLGAANVAAARSAIGITAAGAALVTATDLAAQKALFGYPMPTLDAGAALPTSNIGPIWHDRYASVMVWRSFSANGAAYTGYASVTMGDILTLPTAAPRSGTLHLSGVTVPIASFPQLYHWARDNGLVVNTASWSAGTLFFEAVDAGTMRLPDLRGEFLRSWDAGRGIDTGRTIGSWQNHQLQAHDHVAAKAVFPGSGFGGGGGWGVSNANTGSPTTGNVGTETRGRNTAVLYAIKF